MSVGEAILHVQMLTSSAPEKNLADLLELQKQVEKQRFIFSGDLKKMCEQSPAEICKNQGKSMTEVYGRAQAFLSSLIDRNRAYSSPKSGVPSVSQIVDFFTPLQH